MESSSPAEPPPKRSTHRVANFIGTIIAVLTLATPLLAIAYFSSDPDLNFWPASSYPLVRNRDLNQLE